MERVRMLVRSGGDVYVQRTVEPLRCYAASHVEKEILYSTRWPKQKALLQGEIESWTESLSPY